MSLILDKRTEIGSDRGLHIFIAGVSNYSHLPKKITDQDTAYSCGLRQLKSAALSAYKLFECLLKNKDNFDIPLASCRMLLSPIDKEIKIEPKLQGLADSCSLDNFDSEIKKWREDSASNKQNMTIFYFAGHGAQSSKDDTVLLMDNFGDGFGNSLSRAVDLNNIFKGMANSADYPNMAEKQLYFIDTCRDFLDKYEKFEKMKAAELFEITLTGKEKRIAPIFFAAMPGDRAKIINKEQTLFCEALIDCLENDAGNLEEINGQDVWHVSIHSLSNSLTLVIDELNDKYAVDQEFIISGLAKNDIICKMKAPPKVRIIVEIEPDSALKYTKVKVHDDSGNVFKSLPQPLDPHPHECCWQAGIYSFSGTIDPPNPHFVNCSAKARSYMPPYRKRKIRVLP